MSNGGGVKGNAQTHRGGIGQRRTACVEKTKDALGQRGTAVRKRHRQARVGRGPSADAVAKLKHNERL